MMHVLDLHFLSGLFLHIYIWAKTCIQACIEPYPLITVTGLPESVCQHHVGILLCIRPIYSHCHICEVHLTFVTYNW